MPLSRKGKLGAEKREKITYDELDSELKKYIVDNEDYVSVSGNTLTVKAVGGPTTITASVAGNASYAPASVSKIVKVIDATKPCDTEDNYDEKSLKRAGMDYWDDLEVIRYVNYEEFLEKNPGAKIYYATTKAKHTYTEVNYESDCYIMFGKESAGIPEEILVDHKEDSIRIPMCGEIRSLNLSNSVAIVLYEALRQQNFAQMQLEGELHRLHWKE